MRTCTGFAFLAILLCASTVSAATLAEVREQREQDIERGTMLQAGQFDVALHGRINAWGGWVDDDALLSNGDLLQEYGFRLRRVRLGVSGHLFDEVTYAIEMDLFDRERTGGPLHAAWVDYTPTPYVGVTLGVDKFLHSYGDRMSARFLAHLDRARGVYAMSPGSPMGFVLHSEPWEDHLRIYAGVYNGLERSASFFEGYEGIGVSLGNRFERLSYAGRIEIEPLDPVGRDEVDLEKTKSFRLGLGGAVFYNDGKTNEHLGYSAYLHLKAWGFHLMGEAMFENSKPQKTPEVVNVQMAEQDRMALYGSLGYMVLPEMLGFAVRAELSDDNRDLDNEGDEWSVAATLTWYELSHFLKVQLEYQHREEMEGKSLSNDAVLAGVQLYF